MNKLSDAYVFKLYVLSQDRNLEWFPRLRAKSLAADEGEGEQVELRSLQSQLESTQQLVKCLSQQLTELRDQVRQFRISFTSKIRRKCARERTFFF